MAQAESAVREPTFFEMEAGRYLIRNGRAWLTLTAEDVERGARAVVLDPHYRAEIGRSALRHATEVGDPALFAAISDEWSRLDEREAEERVYACRARRRAGNDGS